MMNVFVKPNEWFHYLRWTYIVVDYDRLWRNASEYTRKLLAPKLSGDHDLVSYLKVHDSILRKLVSY